MLYLRRTKEKYEKGSVIMDYAITNFKSREIDYLEAIKKAQEMGIDFTIVTGREYGAVKSYLEENDLRCECILNKKESCYEF